MQSFFCLTAYKTASKNEGSKKQWFLGFVFWFVFRVRFSRPLEVKKNRNAKKRTLKINPKNEP